MKKGKILKKKSLLKTIFILGIFAIINNFGFVLAQDFVSGEVIVDLKHQFLPADIQVDQDSNIVTGLASVDTLNRLYKCFSFEKIYKGKWTPMQGAYLLKFPDTLDVNQIVNSYAQDFHVQIASPNHIMKTDVTPDDEYFPQQWAHDSTHMQSEIGWQIAPGDSFITIQIIDVCVDWMHPDLKDNIWQNLGEDIDEDGHTIEWDPDSNKWVFDRGDVDGYDDDFNGYDDDFVGYDFHGDYCETPPWGRDNDPWCMNCIPYYASTHGDATSGTAGAVTNNIIGVAGENWYSRIMATKAGAKDSINEAKAVEAMAYGIDNGADVINMSFSGLSPMPFLYDKIDSAYNQYNIILVGSVGNDSSETIHYPAYYDEVMAVAGTDSFDVKRPSSTYGTYVEVSAPGENWVPSRHNKWWEIFVYAKATGTSISAPFVSGLAGLIKGQYQRLWGVTIANDQIRAVIDTSSDDIYDIPGNYPYIGKLGFGRINTLQAVLAISRGDVDNDRQVGLADVTYMINYLFSGGPPPIPDPRIMDCDCNGGAGLNDIMRLIGYLFKGDPKPGICFKY